MKFIKTKIGKIEYENYYVSSSVPDLSSSGTWHRDGEKFFLDENDIRVERKLNYSTFVIILQRQLFNEENHRDDGTLNSFNTYIVDKYERNYGVLCLDNEQSEYIKLVYYDNFFLAYASNEENNWNFLGSCSVEEVIRQGFCKSCLEPIQLKNYTVYSDPFITIENLEKDYKIKLYNTNDELLLERTTEENNPTISRIILDKIIDGYFEIYDTDENLLYKTDTLHLEYGDHYCLTEFDFDFIYQDKIVTNELYTELDMIYSIHSIKIKNNSSESYSNLIIKIENNTSDIIELAYNINDDFESVLNIDKITGKGEIEFLVRITKGPDSPNYTTIKDFLIRIAKK